MAFRPIFEYIHFGEALWYLREIVIGRPISVVLENIDVVRGRLKDFNLSVTYRASYKLFDFGDELKKLDSSSNITQEQATTLSDIMIKLEPTFIAESQGNIAFVVTDKRIDVSKLLYDVPSLLAPDVFNSLTEIARYDFTEAGKCIAFERSTAAAFHLMRATESILRQLYCSFVKRGRVKLMWYPMVKHLMERKHLHFGPLLNHLDNIRLSFRNPTQHPDKIYDIQEAQDLFGLCVDVVNRMTALMEAHKTR